MKVLCAIILVTLSFASAKDFECPNNDYGWYADPENCIRYFHCSLGVSQEYLCPVNDYGDQYCFDETSLICDDCFTVDCGDRDPIRSNKRLALVWIEKQSLDSFNHPY